MKSIRLAYTTEIQSAIGVLEEEYPTLSHAEILKLALGELSKMTKKKREKEIYLSQLGEKRLHEAMSDIAQGKTTLVSSDKDFDTYFDALDKNTDV